MEEVKEYLYNKT